MQLLHDKSITECIEFDDYFIHADESFRIIDKIKEMKNYDCFLFIKTEIVREKGFKQIEMSSGDCKLHDIPETFINSSVQAYDFGIDDNHLVMVLYQSKPEDPIQEKTTIYFNSVIKKDKQIIDYPIANDFMGFMSQLNIRAN